MNYSPNLNQQQQSPLQPGQNQGEQSYVPKIEDQNIIFYSLHPKDTISKQFLEVLNKHPLLDRQFIKICVFPNFQNIRIPQKILQLNKVPVLVPAGFPEPILGEDALSWLTNNAMTTNKSNGLDYGSIDDGAFSQKFSSLTDEFQQTDYNQFFNNDYNLGFDKGVTNNVNQVYSGIKNNDRIVSYDDSHESKKGISDKMKAKLNQLQFQRDHEVPGAQQRAGGLDNETNSNTITGLMNMPTNNPLQYNPNIVAPLQQGGGRMPQMPQMPQQMRGQGIPQAHGQVRGLPQAPGFMNLPSQPFSGGGGDLTRMSMPSRPYADRTAGSHHNAGAFPSPMNMPGGPQGPGFMQQGR